MFGFIGVGNMGSAVAAAVCKSVGGERIVLCGRTPGKAEALARQLGCSVTDGKTAAETCRYLFLGAKPQDMAALLEPLQPVLREHRKADRGTGRRRSARYAYHAQYPGGAWLRHHYVL